MTMMIFILNYDEDDDVHLEPVHPEECERETGEGEKAENDDDCCDRRVILVIKMIIMIIMLIMMIMMIMVVMVVRKD